MRWCLVRQHSSIKQSCLVAVPSITLTHTKTLTAQVRPHRAAGRIIPDLGGLFGFSHLIGSDGQLGYDAIGMVNSSAKRRAALPTGKTAGSNKRRKQDGEQRFYAVRVGRKPGVYMNWADCSEQTSKCKGAVYKSFSNRSDAEAFVAGKNVVAADEPDKFYAVAAGSETGIFNNYADVQRSITGFKGPSYRKFETQSAAVDFILRNGNAEAIKGLRRDGYIDADDSEEEEEEDDDDDDDEDSLVQQLQVETPPAKTSSLPDTSSESEPILDVYTDGASRNNGKPNAKAGYGVYFGQGDPRNISERLPGKLQTNQRAELMAISRALDIVPRGSHVRIYSDSQYAINSLTAWVDKWEKNNWTTATGTPVQNSDIIKPTLAKVRNRAAEGDPTTFEYVKGHSSSVGNAAADKLAVRGATLSAD